ncbi:hypothetical protein AB0J48_22660 [Nocardia salmonicida]|uniref:hypothetical protein n=1 Tax=Nocardia salmonicida TaxID=53431 RepID=UPI0034349FB5
MTPWWQPILGWGGVVIAATIAGGIAVRNARKTPHENLKTLVEILDMSQHIWRDDRRVLEESVHREVQRLDRLNQARVEGFRPYFVERIKQLDPLLPAVVAGLIAAMLASIVVYVTS